MFERVHRLLIREWYPGCVGIHRLALFALPVIIVPSCALRTVPQSAPHPTAEPTVSAPRAASAGPVTSLEEIAGEWDIIEFEGHRPPRLNTDGQRHAYVDINSGGLRFTIGCNYSGMAAAISGDAVLVPPIPDDSMQTAMGCGQEREARDDTFFRFFRSRPQVMLLPDGRLRMEGSGRSLLLERADMRRLAYGPPLAEITGTWRVVAFMQFQNGGHQGWGPMYAPGRVTIGQSTVNYSRCPEVVVQFHYTADFALFRQSLPNTSRPECRGVSPAPTEVEPKLAALLRQSPHAERVPGGRYILRSRNYAVVLASDADYQRQFGEQAAEWERLPG